MPVNEYETRDLPAQESTAEIKPFTLWRPSQFLEYEPPADSFMLGDGFVEAGNWTSFIGIGGLGKSRLLMWLFISIITGREWCGISTFATPRKCVIFCTENGLRRWKTDLRNVRETLTPREWQLVDENLEILALTTDETGNLNLDCLESRDRIRVSLDRNENALIGFDPLADLSIGDESKTADMAETIRTLRKVIKDSASRSAAVVIVHHARTGASNVAQAGDNYSAGNFGRGSKALYSAVRCEIQLAPGDKEDPNKIVLACGKANDTPKFASRGIIFNGKTYVVDPEFDVDAWRADVNGQRSNSTGPSVLDVARAVKKLCPYATSLPPKKGDIDDAMGVGNGETTRKTIGNKLKKAIDLGYLEKGAKQGEYRLGSKSIPDA